MKKWLSKIWWVIVPIILMLGMYGCISYIDPETGQKLYSADPNNGIIKAFDWVARTVPAVTPAAAVVASVFFPGVVPIVTLVAGLLGGLIGAWKKLKPQVVQAQTLTTQTRTVLTSVITAIEDYKTANPAEWEKLKVELQKFIPKGSTADDLISVIRGVLPVAN
jgi:hypothetical protein